MKDKITKGEMFLLGLTALFLCGLLVLSGQESARPGVTVSAAVEVPQEVIRPDVSPLDLNTATVDQLVELPGIGEELAERILAYRAEYGPFEATEDLMKVSGIGEGKLAALDGYITVEKGSME